MDNLTSTSNINKLFPVFFKLEQLRVLLIGGGNVALEKLQAIINNSPNTKVKVITRAVNEDFSALANANENVCVAIGDYDASYLNESDLVIAAVNDIATSEQIRNDAKQAGKLINVADKPELCDFYLGSIVTKGSLKLAISTNGKSPTVAKRLKEVFNELLPDELEQVLDNLQQIRNELKGDFQHKVSELNKITKTLIEKPAPKDAEDYWFL
ncbi:bifunctional precorrin-2 dehydrogenase/sirohydrochlorin ferrochelatase [Danxiaibacter flavus]|uniref:precorrin-2 dehydrogenase n=1 Tax=Danxiaibacter flavus TaxID=3049108 RepID=A0ABV3ZBA5_9BACT|nr:bifunctional precorrin-2 dehydrogenase/sirohydrochlorin ferrochelatase [Chitinophagaceae bacterium DXS]